MVGEGITGSADTMRLKRFIVTVQQFHHRVPGRYPESPVFLSSSRCRSTGGFLEKLLNLKVQPPRSAIKVEPCRLVTVELEFNRGSAVVSKVERILSGLSSISTE
jgi:hypothetical protein